MSRKTLNALLLVFVQVVDTSGNHVFVVNLKHGIELSGNTCDVVFYHNLGTGFSLFFLQCTNFDKDF